MKKQYLINIKRKYSYIALVASIISLICSSYSIFLSMFYYIDNNLPITDMFQYFTQLSGVFGGVVTSFIIPYAIDGLQKKRFTYPKWLAILHYSSVVCTGLVFFFSMTIISWFDPVLAFQRPNILLHYICPLLILLAFLSIESNHTFSMKEVLISLSPIFIYMCVYTLNVVILKRREDLYQFTIILPFYVSFILMLLLSFVIAFVIKFIHTKKYEFNNRQLTRNWKDDIDPVTIKIEVYGFGRYMGMNNYENDIDLNLDILKAVSDKYNIELDELVRAYTKGILDAVKFEK